MSMVHWMVVLGAGVLLFGGGRLSATMGDIGRGIAQFRRGMADEATSLAAHEDH